MIAFFHYLSAVALPLVLFPFPEEAKGICHGRRNRFPRSGNSATNTSFRRTTSSDFCEPILYFRSWRHSSYFVRRGGLGGAGHSMANSHCGASQSRIGSSRYDPRIVHESLWSTATARDAASSACATSKCRLAKALFSEQLRQPAELAEAAALHPIQEQGVRPLSRAWKDSKSSQRIFRGRRRGCLPP